MKRINNILGIFTLAMVLMLPSGCAKESLSDEPTSSEGKVRLRINTDNGEFQIPSTRATANENAVDDVWVLVFKGSDYNATFVEAVKSIVTESERYVLLTQATGAHKLLVVANADTFINAKKALLTAGTTTLTGAISILQYGNPYNSTIPGDGALANPQIAMPFADPAKNIPMCEVLSVSRISSTTEINATGTAGGGTLELRRITAKVVVDGSAVFAKFKILGVAAYQGARSTVSLVPGDNNAIQTGGTFINYHKGTVSAPTDICTAFTPNLAAENNTENYPVYVYESTGTANFIIIKAKLGNAFESYYKLRLGKGDGTNYDIKRNCKYIFKITSVPNGTAGYPYLGAAFNGAESNIAGRVIELKDDNSTEIIDNGSYYLACSNSEYISYSYGCPMALSNQAVALTITTNATSGIMLGYVNSIKPTNLTGLMIVAPSNMKLNTVGETDVATTNVSVTFHQAFQPSRQTQITMSLGSLVKRILVRREPMFNYLAETRELVTNCVSAKVTAGSEWLSLGVVDDPEQGSAQVIPDQQGRIYLFARASFEPRIGEVYLARNNNQGRVRISVLQGGAYPAFPGVIGYDPVRGDLNLEGRGHMVYFKYGGIIAMYAAYDNDTWSSDDVAFNPTDITIGAYNSFPIPVAYGSTIGNMNVLHSLEMARRGNGDPCRFIKPDGSGMTVAEVKTALASETLPDHSYWRLPTNSENEEVAYFPAQTTWVQRESPSYPTLMNGHTCSGLNKGSDHANAAWDFLPAPGYRLHTGVARQHNSVGWYWSSTQGDSDDSGYGSLMRLFGASPYIDPRGSQILGLAVRCVRQ